MVNDVIFRDRGQSRHGLTSEPRCGHGRAMLKWIARIVLIFVAGSVLWVMAYRLIKPPPTMTMTGAWLDRRKIHPASPPMPEIDSDMAPAARSPDGRIGDACVATWR